MNAKCVVVLGMDSRVPVGGAPAMQTREGLHRMDKYKFLLLSTPLTQYMYVSSEPSPPKMPEIRAGAPAQCSPTILIHVVIVASGDVSFADTQ